MYNNCHLQMNWICLHKEKKLMQRIKKELSEFYCMYKLVKCTINTFTRKADHASIDGISTGNRFLMFSNNIRCHFSMLTSRCSIDFEEILSGMKRETNG